MARLHIHPSRLLNDTRNIFGLTMTDFASGVAVFVFTSLCLDGTGFEIASFPIALSSLVPLVPLRLTTRRKIIRDTVFSKLKGAKLYDPRLRS